MKQLLSFLFKKQAQNQVTEIVRAVRVLVKKKRSIVFAISRSVLTRTDNTVEAQEIVSSVYQETTNSILLTGSGAIKRNISSYFPTNLYYSNLTDLELTALGLAKNRSYLVISIDNNGKLAVAYQNSIRAGLPISKLKNVIETMVSSPSGIRKKYLEVEVV